MYPEILAFGEPMYEFSKLKQATGDGNFKSGFGGDVSNFAISAARQGAKVGMLCHLGDDMFAKEFINLWEKEGVNSDNVVINSAAFTAVYFITHDSQGHHFDFLRNGSAASLITPAQLPEAAIGGAKLLHVSGITHAISASSSDSVFAAIEIAKNNQTLVSFDTNLRLKLWSKARARAIIDATVGISDICFPSVDEAMLLTGIGEPQAIIDYYLKLGAKLVVLKLGAEGAIAATESQRIKVKANRVELVDATGAGDTFAGAFCHNYLANKELAYCLQYANLAAALSVMGYGAVDPIPCAAQVIERIAQSEVSRVE